jgi:hypothetical protein
MVQIFSYLDVNTLRRVVLVNRAWYSHNKDRRTVSLFRSHSLLLQADRLPRSNCCNYKT